MSPEPTEQHGPAEQGDAKRRRPSGRPGRWFRRLLGAVIGVGLGWWAAGFW